MAIADLKNEVHVGDIGTAIQVTLYDGSTALDVSGAASLTMYLTKPSGTTLTKTATNVTDGTNGQIKYTTISGDIDEAGLWTLQVKVVLVNGNTWYTDVARFRVFSNLV